MALHRKFALPFACFVLAVVGLGLGVQHGRGGKLAAFVPGIAVVFVYYIIDYGGRQMAKGQLLPPWLAVWLPNLVLGAVGVALLVWRAQSSDKPIRLTLPTRWKLWSAYRGHRRTGHQVPHGRRPAAAGLASAGPSACSTPTSASSRSRWPRSPSSACSASSTSRPSSTCRTSCSRDRRPRRCWASSSTTRPRSSCSSSSRSPC